MINNKLFINWLTDLKKPEFDDYERAELIQEYIREKGISMREFARQNGFSKSCIQDWLVVLRVPKEKYLELIAKKGRTNTYRILRNTKKENIAELKEIDLLLEEITFKLNQGNIKTISSNHTLDKVKELQKAVNTALFRLTRD